MVTYLTFPTSKAIIKAFIEYCTPDKAIELKKALCKIILQKQDYHQGVRYNGHSYLWWYGEELPESIEFNPSRVVINIF